MNKYTKALIIMVQLIKNNDIKSLEAFKRIFKDNFNEYFSIEHLFYFEQDLCFKCLNCINKNGQCLTCYFCNLEYDLTEINNCGYSITYIVEVLLEILETKYKYIDLNALTPIQILNLFVNNGTIILDTTPLLEIMEYNQALALLQDILTQILTNMTIKQLNSFLKDYATYNKCSKVQDIIFLRNDKIYLNNCIDSNKYSIVEIEQVVSFIEDFINSIEYLEDMEFIFNFIL